METVVVGFLQGLFRFFYMVRPYCGLHSQCNSFRLEVFYNYHAIITIQNKGALSSRLVSFGLHACLGMPKHARCRGGMGRS
jgi:hypothetical protein